MADLSSTPKGFTHGFLPGCSDRTEVSKVIKELGLEEIVQVNQVHGNRVIHWEHDCANCPPGRVPSADGIISGTRGRAVSIVTADCVPVIIYSEPDDNSENGNVAVIHAGWRGLDSCIVKKGVEKLGAACLERVFAIIGPAAGPCCYEISEDMAVRFSKRWSESVNRRSGAFYMDLRFPAKQQLTGAGVLNKNIHISPHCTVCGSEIFPSYRRDGDNAGRMVTFAGFISSVENQ